MTEIPTWITTVGWSSYAVINPIWAYCKENEKENKKNPDKIILLFSKENHQIKKNVEKCKNTIFKILKNYSDPQFKLENIIECPFEKEDIDVYAEKLLDVIKKEIGLNADKIILDMTPGRKYMSALNMIYGNSDFKSEVIIYVLYFYLEDNKYINVPYPMIPTIKNYSIDIFDYSNIFPKDLKSFIGTDQMQDEIKVNLIKIFKRKYIENDKNQQELNEFLILFAIFLKNDSITQIFYFIKNQDKELNRSVIREFINDFKNKEYILISEVVKNKLSYKSNKLTQKGHERLMVLINQFLSKGENND